jgi:uncharacterized protein YlxP (DUF503 family)
VGQPVCGLLVIELRLAGNRSLKGKRQVVKSLKDRLRNRFNVSVAELPPLDDHETAVLGLAMIGSDRTFVEGGLSRALAFVEETHLAEVTDATLEFP